MTDRALQRLGAATGLVFVLSSVLSAFVYPQQPRVDSPPATTLAWVHNHRVALQTGMVIGLFSAALLVWFVAHLRDLVERAGDGGGLAPVVFGSGIAMAAVTALSAMPIALLAFMDAQRGGLQDLSVVRMLGDLNIVLFAASSAMTAVFVFALGLSILRARWVAPWVGSLSLVVAACNAVSVWTSVTFSTYHGKAWGAVGWGAYVGLLVVIAIVGGLLVAGRRDTPAVSPAMAMSGTR